MLGNRAVVGPNASEHISLCQDAAGVVWARNSFAVSAAFKAQFFTWWWGFILHFIYTYFETV